MVLSNIQCPLWFECMTRPSPGFFSGWANCGGDRNSRSQPGRAGQIRPYLCSPGGTAKGTHRPSQQERRNKASQRSHATDDADRSACFLWEQERDDLEDAAVAESRRRAADENHGTQSHKRVQLEKGRKAESSQRHHSNRDGGYQARAELVRQPASEGPHHAGNRRRPR